MKLGIIAALSEEIEQSKSAMDVKRVHKIAMRNIYQGDLYGVDTRLCLSRVGKVSAATTASLLIHHFNVDAIIFTGVAGGAQPYVNVGDIVVATGLVQHDLDARPIFPQYQVPLLNKDLFSVDPRLQQQSVTACQQLNIDVTVHQGLIASGDRFIHCPEDLSRIREQLNQHFQQPLLCVEMEGAAVAQVCYEHAVPLAVIRIISDNADQDAAIDFQTFIDQIAAPYSDGILRQLYQQLRTTGFTQEFDLAESN